jgi:hypothetical protein
MINLFNQNFYENKYDIITYKTIIIFKDNSQLFKNNE